MANRRPNCSDTDTGPNADPGGRGRRCGGGQGWPRSNVPTHTRHCTDSDRGNNADPVQAGAALLRREGGARLSR